MNFNAQDIDVVESQKQYIDTVLIPLIHIDFTSKKIKNSAVDANFLLSVTHFVEMQLKGRLLLLPPTTYTESTLPESLLPNMQQQLVEAGFKHIVFITSDLRWKTHEQSYSIIWLPAIPLESMDNSMKAKILEEQLKQVIPYLTDAWSNEQLTTL